MKKTALALACLSIMYSATLQAHQNEPIRNGSECEEITQRQLKRLERDLVRVRGLAMVDFRDNGVTGRYAAASKKHKNAIDNVIKEVRETIKTLDRKENNDSTVTTYVEGSRVLRSLYRVNKLVANGEWWSVISAINHDRNEGNDSPAFKSSLAQGDIAHQVRWLIAKAKYCYTGPYLF